MKMSIYNKPNIIETQKRAQENTINFENCSSFFKYEDESSDMKTSLGLCMEENFIMNEVIPYIKAEGNVKMFSKETAEEFYKQPLKLSKSLYGCIDYWWIIMAANGYFNAQEFHGWLKLIIPTVDQISQIIDKETYINPDIGNLESL